MRALDGTDTNVCAEVNIQLEVWRAPSPPAS